MNTKKLTLEIVIIFLLFGAIAAYAWMTHEPQGSKASGVDQTKESKSAVKTRKATLHSYYVALNDQGKSGAKIGCGDSIVQVDNGSVDTANPVQASLDLVLTNHSKDYGESGLYNALYQSDLHYVSSTVNGDSVNVALSGKIVQSGACDAPRIEAQLVNTVKSAVNAKVVNITVNDEPLTKVLSSN